ncbi:hypothetical protein HK104_010123 [Borealophlyctis nickersoniae]|nr:hypothetical protein HK104_010123 [Borealophlyctis nickersoniae]
MATNKNSGAGTTTPTIPDNLDFAGLLEQAEGAPPPGAGRSFDEWLAAGVGGEEGTGERTVSQTDPLSFATPPIQEPLGFYPTHVDLSGQVAQVPLAQPQPQPQQQPQQHQFQFPAYPGPAPQYLGQPYHSAQPYLSQFGSGAGPASHRPQPQHSSAGGRRYHPYAAPATTATFPFSPASDYLSDVSGSEGTLIERSMRGSFSSVGSGSGLSGGTGTTMYGSENYRSGGASESGGDQAGLHEGWAPEAGSGKEKEAMVGVVQDPVSFEALAKVAAVVNQLMNVVSTTPLPRPLSLFDDLPPLPDQSILNSLIRLYFEKMSPTISIIHETAFYRSASLPPPEDPTKFMCPPYHHLPPTPGLSPVLLYSMLACSARHHPTLKLDTALIQSTFYERARRLMLPSLDHPTLNHLKALLHLTLFAVEQSLWMAGYMWLGNSVTMGRFLGLYNELPADMRDAPEPDKVGGLTVQQIEAEEGRRCWWWIRCHDACVFPPFEVCHFLFLTAAYINPFGFLRSGSAASKRPQMISDTEFASTLNLPTPDALFYATRFGLPPTADVTNNTGTLPLTLTLNDFLSPTSSKPHAHATLGPNGYLCVLIALFNRVTQFRQECNRENILPFAPGESDAGERIGKEYKELAKELRGWYEKLPGRVKQLGDARSGSGRPEDVSSALYWSEESARETYEWGMDVVIYHATAATLHGPEYNMMTMGNQIAGTLRSFGGGGPAGPPGGARRGGTYRPPHHIAASFMSAARLDQVLTSWQHSESFGKSLEHAARGTIVLEEMMENMPEEKRRDTPFFEPTTFDTQR